MSTSMPYISPIEVTVEQVSYLRHLGPGSLLIWIEPTGRVQVLPPTGELGGHRMIIASGCALDGLTEMAEEDGRHCDDATLASDLSDIANDWLCDWAQVRAMTPMLTPIRRRLDRQGIYPAASVEFRHDGTCLPTITDTYARPDGKAGVRVTVPLGYAEPVQFHTRTTTDHSTVIDHELQLDYMSTTAEHNEALIAATVAACLTLGNV
ncbi:hypothetical protein Q8791_17035 [Nocardiopsis sp. CT-R113]|uniref:DUF1828 domain-containing protein n=1 Tax=Nocardiopsis codii TaxID=3065942 RepID=A0ABU7K9K8_9ACTN|nr:hypothetical protein [Nocardiopsis sp. CT-R113]MEE2038925.1 hypothetical protein [Nocardiopsis sp. CT-R113]